jgi:endonuclease III
MDKVTILKWNDKYDKDHSWWTEKEKEVGDKFRKTKMATKDDLRQVVDWKFKEIEGRRTRILGFVEKNADSEVRKISSDVFGSTLGDEYKIDSLQNLRGVGPAVASVILTFYNPKDYGVFDIHVWREVFGKEPKGYQFTTKDYLKVLGELRKKATQLSLNVRTVEKALFKKNYDESNKEP